MRIRTRLWSLFGASLALAVLAAALVFAAGRREDDASDAQTRAQITEHETASLLALTQEYARYAEPRVAQQWRLRHGAIATALEDDGRRAMTAGPALAELRSLTLMLPALFTRLEAIPPDADGFAQRRKEALLDELLADTQAMSDDAYQWYQDSVAMRRAAQREFRWVALTPPCLVVVLLLAAALGVRRRVLLPVRRLDQAAAAIRRGDLSFRIASREQDELGDLAREFDAMAAALGEAGRRRDRSEQQLRDVTDNLPALVGYIDLEHRYRFANQKYLAWLGCDPRAMLGLHVRDVLGAETYDTLRPHLQAAMRGERVQWQRTHRDTRGERHLLVEYIPDRAADGTVRGFYSLSMDVTERREAEARLAGSERKLRDITDNLPVMITYVDSQERVRFVNRTGMEWLRKTPGELLGQRARDCLAPEDYDLNRPHLLRALAGERAEYELAPSDERRGRSLQCVFLPDVKPDGSVAGAYGLATDVSALKNVERQLSLLVRSDALTGLSNRYEFNEQMPQALARARRAGSGIALMYLDIDRFKAINDSLGHAQGDAVLQAFAQRVSQSVRSTDSVARLGGDEFVVILEGLHGEGEPQFVARKIIANVTRPLDIEGRPMQVSTSIGVAFCRRVGEAQMGDAFAQRLLLRADEALYEAKEAGRNTFRMLCEGPPEPAGAATCEGASR